MFEHNAFIKLKDKYWLRKQLVAGQCVNEILKTFAGIVESENNINVKDFEKVAGSIFEKHNCKPTFLGYKGFPSNICVSINEEIVHGIPKDYILQSGDVVKFDLGATFYGTIADAAITCIYKEPKKQEHIELLYTCREALELAIKSIALDKRIGMIGETISKFVKNTRFGLITDYGGHGIDFEKPHAPPFIANKDTKNNGIYFQNGMTFAIEPMLVCGIPETKVQDDGWTVKVPGVSAHFEHTIYIDEGKPVVIT